MQTPATYHPRSAYRRPLHPTEEFTVKLADNSFYSLEFTLESAEVVTSRGRNLKPETLRLRESCSTYCTPILTIRHRLLPAPSFCYQSDSHQASTSYNDNPNSNTFKKSLDAYREPRKRSVLEAGVSLKKSTGTTVHVLSAARVRLSQMVTQSQHPAPQILERLETAKCGC